MTSIEALTIDMMTKMATSLPLTPEIQAKARAMSTGVQPVTSSIKPAVDRDDKKMALNSQLKGLF